MLMAHYIIFKCLIEKTGKKEENTRLRLVYAVPQTFFPFSAQFETKKVPNLLDKRKEGAEQD